MTDRLDTRLPPARRLAGRIAISTRGDNSCTRTDERPLVQYADYNTLPRWDDPSWRPLSGAGVRQHYTKSATPSCT